MSDIQSEPQFATEDFLEQYLPELPQEIKEVLINIMQIRREIREKAEKMDEFTLSPPTSSNPLPEIKEGALKLENRLRYFSKVKQEIVLDSEKGIELITFLVKTRIFRDVKRSEKVTINSNGFSVERTIETNPVFLISKKGPHTVSANNQSFTEPVSKADISFSPGAKQIVVFNDGLSIESLEGVTLMDLLDKFKKRLQKLSNIAPLNLR